MTGKRMKLIKPQAGPQTAFLSSPADIVFYGGAAGGGKSFALLLDPLRHYGNPLFRGIAFRRTIPELKMPGGLLDTGRELYMPIGGKPRESPGDLDFRFKAGWQLKFSHLQRDSTVYQYQGLQAAWAGFDELTHFTWAQFSYIMSRLRSMANIMPRTKGTCNPDPDSWVKEIILWWLDEKGQYADPEKAGVVRWFLVDEESDQFLWFDSRNEIELKYGRKMARLAKSFTFIPAMLSDNKILLDRNPAYEANLAMQDRVTRLRLAKGDWLVRAVPGIYFKRRYFREVNAFDEVERWVRFWDRAATEYEKGKNDPDYTFSCLMGKTIAGDFVIADVSGYRVSAGKVESMIIETAKADRKAGRDVEVWHYKDPGAAGKGEAERLVALLTKEGFFSDYVPAIVSKEVNCRSFSAHAELKGIQLYRNMPGQHKDLFLGQLEAFPSTSVHDDAVDAGSGAFNVLNDASEVGIF